MRSIRRAAIAGATAASLILGAASAATAEEENHDNNGLSSSITSGSSKDKDGDKEGQKEKKEGKDEGLFSGLSSNDKEGKEGKEGEKKDKGDFLRTSSTRIGDQLEADKPANGDRLFGSTDDANKEPKWARYMKYVTVISLVGSFFGLVVFPAYNFAVANHLIVK